MNTIQWYRIYKDGRKAGFVWADSANVAHAIAKRRYPNNYIEAINSLDYPTLKRQVIT